MFFKKKSAPAEIKSTLVANDVIAEAVAEVEAEQLAAAAPKAEMAAEAVEAPKAELASDTIAEMPAEASASEEIIPAAEAGTSNDLHLFPGFEAEEFDIAYAVLTEGNDKKTPMLMMRWKEAASEDWFPVPPMFNASIITKIQDRENDKDLNRLLDHHGYNMENFAG